MNNTIVSLALIALMASTSQRVCAAPYHANGKLVPPLTAQNYRVRNATAHLAPVSDWRNGVTDFDEALSPPAGR